MFMTTAERKPPPAPARATNSRSPFVRLRELLGDAEPGKPAISLAVGEPQHPVPGFGGPVLAPPSPQICPLSEEKSHGAVLPRRRRLARPPIRVAAAGGPRH